MAYEKGRELLLKEGSVSGSPTTVAGVRTTSFTVNTQDVDTTNKDSSGYRVLLEGAGTQDVSISVEGVYDNGAASETVRGYALAGSINVFSLFFPSGDTFECSFLITSYEHGGDYNDAETFSMTLVSSGNWTFTNN